MLVDISDKHLLCSCLHYFVGETGLFIKQKELISISLAHFCNDRLLFLWYDTLPVHNGSDFASIDLMCPTSHSININPSTKP